MRFEEAYTGWLTLFLGCAQYRYNRRLSRAITLIMEAEQLNLITNNLQDLRARTGELRRYL